MWVSSYLALTFGCPVLGVMLFTIFRVVFLKRNKYYTATSQILTLYYLITITAVPIVFSIYAFGLYCPRLALNLYLVGRTAIAPILLLSYSMGYCKCNHKHKEHRPISPRLIMITISMIVILLTPHVIITACIKDELNDNDNTSISFNENSSQKSVTIKENNNKNKTTSNLEHVNIVIGKYTHIVNIVFSIVEGISVITLIIFMLNDHQKRPSRRSLSETENAKKYLKSKKIKSQKRIYLARRYHFALLYTMNIVVYQIIHIQCFHIFFQASISRIILNIILNTTSMSAHLGLILTCYKFEVKKKLGRVNLKREEVVKSIQNELKNIEIMYLKKLFDLLIKIKVYIFGIQSLERVIENLNYKESNLDNIKHSMLLTSFTFLNKEPCILIKENNENTKETNFKENKHNFIFNTLISLVNLMNSNIKDIENIKNDVVNKHETNQHLVRLKERVNILTVGYKKKIQCFSLKCNKYKNKSIKDNAFKEIIKEYYNLQKDFLENIGKTIRNTLEEDVYLKSIFA